MSKGMRRLLSVVVLLCGVRGTVAISSLANNDPYPMYSAIYDPQMTTWSKEYRAGFRDCYTYEWFGLSITPFFQKANTGRTFDHQRAVLGDLNGPLNILGLLYGPRPAGTTFVGTPLGLAENSIFSNFFFEQQSANPNPIVPLIPNSTLTGPYILDDPNEQVGYVSAPFRYRKMGARFELDFHPFEDLGFTVQVGVSEIRQTMTGFINRGAGQTCNIGSLDGSFVTGTTCPFNDFCNLIPTFNGTSYATCDQTSPTTAICTTAYCEIQSTLLDPVVLHTIFNEIGLDDCNFEETSFEDVRLFLWWRHIFAVNEQQDNCCWPAVLVVPSLEVNGVIPTAKKRDRTKFLALPFGNDGFYSVGFDAGLALDFIETVEIAFHAGMSHFFGRDVSNYRLPTSEYQSGIFPFATDVHVKPGNSFNVNASLWAYRFYDHFSAWVEWAYVKHEQDDLSLVNDSLSTLFSASNIRDAECGTKFMSQFVNASISYELSPNLSIAIMGQFPVSQRNAYRSTTWLGTFRAQF